MNSQVPCCPTHHCELEFFGTTGTSESPTDDLRCMWCEFLRLKEENAVLRSQVENADINLEQVRMAQKSMCRTKLESAESEITRVAKENERIRKESEELLSMLPISPDTLRWSKKRSEVSGISLVLILKLEMEEVQKPLTHPVSLEMIRKLRELIRLKHGGNCLPGIIAVRNALGRYGEVEAYKFLVKQMAAWA